MYGLPYSGFSDQSLGCPRDMRASLVIAVLGTVAGVWGWTGLEDEGSGEFGVTEATTAVADNIDTAVAVNIVTEEGYVIDNANGNLPSAEPTPMDFIDPADFMGPQVF